MISGMDAENGFHFRELHPAVYLGTASDRYAGWIGQIYPEQMRTRISRRTKQVGRKKFVEEVVPVESVKDYFRHFRVLEVDFTFYEGLLDSAGKPTRTHRTLSRYLDFLSPQDRLTLKTPQPVFARKLRGRNGYAFNPGYLDADFFVRRFYEPAVALAGPWLAGFIFEQAYQRQEDRPEVLEHARELDSFFAALPPDSRYHVELRTAGLWGKDVWSVLESHGVGQVLSHWTWLPPLEKQFAAAGGRCRNGGRTQIIRLMTPRGVRYEDAYARAFPFNALVEGMSDRRMIEDTARIMWALIEGGATVQVMINNRAAGNAPLTAQQLALAFKRLGQERDEGRS